MSTFHVSDVLHSGLTGVDRINTAGTVPNVDAASSNLWLTVWGGEVLNAYDEFITFEPRVMSKTITSGTTLKFPMTGTVALKPQWGAGEELAGGGGPTTNFDVTLDDRPMAAHFELDNPDLMVTQFDYRSEMARQTGMTLANTSDKQVSSLIAQAAAALDANFALTKVGTPRKDADGSVAGEGGQVFTGDGHGTGNGGDGSSGTDRGFDYDDLGNRDSLVADRTDAALGLLEDIEHFYVHLAEINAPSDGVTCCVTPQAFQDIRSLNIARESGDFADGGGHPFYGGGATDMGGLGAPLTVGLHAIDDTLIYQGCTIIKSLHANIGVNYTVNDLRTTQIGDERYGVNLFNLRGLIWQPLAVARLSLQGMKVDSVEDVRRNTHFTVASTFKGGSTFREECAGLMMIN